MRILTFHRFWVGNEHELASSIVVLRDIVTFGASLLSKPSGWHFSTSAATTIRELENAINS